MSNDSIDILVSSESVGLASSPCWDGYKQVGMKKGKSGKMVPNCVPINASTDLGIAAILADADGYDGECPPATQDIQLNLTNRQNAIDNVGYGPLNPAEPNEEFWQDKGDRWNITPEEAKTARCGNCIFFIRTPKMLNCIEEGIGLGSQEAQGSIEAGELGYCNALDFKCASERTCNAWAAGGPVTEESPVTASTATINEHNSCLSEDLNFAVKKKRTISQTPAPKKDRIKGSKKNPKGSASGTKAARKVVFSAKTEKALQNKVTKHNEKAPDGRRASLGMLKAVFRRGAGAYSVSHRPGMTRDGWAFARVNAFLKLLKSGKPKNAAYVSDNDLLPASHPRSTKKSASITAAVIVPEEQDLAAALLEIATKYGKFNEDETGIWAGYTPADQNENASIGVKCVNCVLYAGGTECLIISLPVEPEGMCRFAVIPDGLVSPDAIKKPKYDEMQEELDNYYQDLEITISIGEKEDYEYPEDAVLALTEYSGFGYEAENAVRASWLRAVRNNEDPFKRAYMFASLGEDSLDSDLIPKDLEDENE